MKTSFSVSLPELLALLALVLSGGPPSLAQTILSGPVSGVWDLSGSPYVLVDNCTVPAGAFLKINPGVSVIMGSNVTLTVSGNIQAVGSASQHIVISGAAPTAPYQYIDVFYSATDSHFAYCDFRYANWALYFEAIGTGTNFTPVISNCTFSNINNIAVGTKSFGKVHVGLDGNYAMHSYLNAVVRNCIFSSCWKGFSAYTLGSLYEAPWIYIQGLGYASPRIENNVFYNISNVAVEFDTETFSGLSTPLVANNTMANCQYAVAAYDPSDVTIKNNIVTGNNYGVWRNGTRSGTVGFNCFYQNGTNFLNYPGSFGQVVMQNRNGTACDVAYNLFMDPMLAAGSHVRLQPPSPCVDAGDGAGTFLDCCTNSLGTTVNDIGPCGGPQACGWLQSTNTAFSLVARQYVGVTINPNSPGRYRVESCPNVGSPIWTQVTNIDLLSTPFTFIDYDSPGVNQRFYRAIFLP